MLLYGNTFALVSSLMFAAIFASAPSRPTCTSTQLICLLRSGHLNCSSQASFEASMALSSEVASFLFHRSSNTISLALPNSAKRLSNVTVTNLHELAQCFQLGYTVILHLVSGSTAFQFLPGALNAFSAIQKLTLWVRFSGDRILRGVFTSQLSNLRNLEVESPRILEIQPGAFQELRRLVRLSVRSFMSPQLSGAELRGLNELRVLELLDNSITELNSASFAATPNLETIDLRPQQQSSWPVRFAANTFCGLQALLDLKIPGSMRALGCQNFASGELRLTIANGRQEQSLICTRSSGERTLCGEPTGSATSAQTVAAIGTSATIKISTKLAATTVSPARPSSIPETSTTSTTSTTLTTSIQSSQSTASVRLISITSTTSSDRRAASSNRQAHASSAGSAAVAVGVVAAALILACAGVAGFMLARSRRGTLRRAQSRQPIFTASRGGNGSGSEFVDSVCLGGSIDMQDSLWNPVFQGSEAQRVREERNQRTDDQ